jgi:hypothetical protein
VRVRPGFCGDTRPQKHQIDQQHRHKRKDYPRSTVRRSHSLTHYSSAATGLRRLAAPSAAPAPRSWSAACFSDRSSCSLCCRPYERTLHLTADASRHRGRQQSDARRQGGHQHRPHPLLGRPGTSPRGLGDTLLRLGHRAAKIAATHAEFDQNIAFRCARGRYTKRRYRAIRSSLRSRDCCHRRSRGFRRRSLPLDYREKITRTLLKS